MADFFIPSTKKYKSTATLDDNTDLSEGNTTRSGSSRSSGDGFFIPSTKSWSQRAKKLEEDKKKSQARQILLEQQASEAKAAAERANPVGTFLKNASDVAKSVGEGMASAYNRIGQGTAEVINEVSGNAQKERDANAARNAEDLRIIKSLGDKIKGAKTEEEKQRYRNALSKISKISDIQDTEFKNRQSQIAERTNSAKAAGAIAEIGLDVATAGIGGAAVKGGKSAILGVKEGAKVLSKESGKQIVKTVGKNSAVGAGVGGLYGAASTLEDKGAEATAGDYAKGIATGAAVGAAIPAVGAVKYAKPVQAVDKFISDTAKSVARKASNTKVGNAVGNVAEKVQTALGETLAPVMRDFKGLKDANGRQINEEVRLLDSNVTNSAAITEGRLKENEAWQQLGTLLQPDKTRPGSLRAARKEKDEIGKFINAKQEAINSQKLGKENVEIPVGTPKQEEAYRLLNKATKDDVQYAYDNNLITEANYKKYMADDNYTRVQRDMGDLLESQFKGVGGANGSIGKVTTFSQRLKGSKRDSVDPFAAHFDWSSKVTREVERQKLSSYIIEQRQANGLGKGYLRKAEDVETRVAAAGEAAQLRVLRNGLDKAIKIESRYVRKLQTELNGLSKDALQKSIKGAGSTAKLANKPGTKALINQLVKTSTSDLQRLRNKIGNREPKVQEALDNIIGLKEQHDIASKAVKELVDIARANGDKITTNTTNIKTFKRGIKEIYEDEPRIVNAINKIGRVELNAIIRTLQAPSKLIQRTATALNPLFTLPNFGKDQISSFINSKNGAATHNPVAFMVGLKESVLKPTVRATLRGVGARQTAEKVLKPTAEYEQFLKYVAGATRADITRNLKKTARMTAESLGLKNDSPIRKLENINSATELSTRFQNYWGTLKSDLKKGVDLETAEKNAIQAARENSVDFSRQGDWSAYLKIVNPFANANIQGSRSLIRAFQERPIATSLKVAATISTPIAISTYWNLSDPERALIYSQLSDFDKESNLIFITGDGVPIKFPLPPGVRELGAPIRGLIEAEYGMGEQSFVETARQLLVDPFNPSSGTGDMVPQIAKPVVENWANKSFFTGEAIIPENQQDKDVSEQVFKGTGQTYRDIGAILGVSPLIAKNTIKGYGSSVAEQTVSLIDNIRKLGNPDVVAEKDSVTRLKEKFVDEKPDQEAAAKNVFFEAYNPAKKQRDKVSKQVTELVKAGKINEAKRRAEEYNDSLKGKFSKFGKDYKEYQNSDLNELLDSLPIPVTVRAFKSRYND